MSVSYQKAPTQKHNQKHGSHHLISLFVYSFDILADISCDSM